MTEEVRVESAGGVDSHCSVVVVQPFIPQMRIY